MAELGVSLCFFCRQNHVWSNINADPIKRTPPWLFSFSHFFPNIFHIHSETDIYFMQICHLRGFRNTTGLCLHNRDNKAKQASSKASCELLTGGDLDILYTHQYSFQILILPIRKVDGKYVFSIFHFSNFPKDIHTLSLFRTEPDLPMVDTYHTVLSAISWYLPFGVSWDLAENCD